MKTAISIALLTLATAACTNTGPITQDPADSQRFRELITEAQPSSGTVQISPELSLKLIGPAKLGSGAPQQPQPKNAKREIVLKENPKATYGQVQMRVFNTRTQMEFEMTTSQKLLDAVHGLRERKGLTRATEGVADPTSLETPITPQGWSGGDDSRVVFSSTTTYPWRTIAQSDEVGGDGNSNCTFTFIGPRHLITAAHCIVNLGTSNWKTRQITPGRNGVASSPYGSSVISPNPAPGTETWYFVPSGWLNCSGEFFDCEQWDWGLIVIPDRLGDTVGWMGYGAYTVSELKQYTHYNRGYAKCNIADYSAEPAGCQLGKLYGDVNPCEIGSYNNPDSDGWNRNLKVSCDLSKGHSGSAMYHYRYNSQLQRYMPVVTAVVSYENCSTCSDASGSTKSYPNGVRRITAADLEVISWLREVFP